MPPRNPRKGPEPAENWRSQHTPPTRRAACRLNFTVPLDEAYQQLLLYREDLENPPLLVVCDLDRFEVHTNFTGTAKRVYAFDLAGLADPKNLDTLRKAFTNPEALRPGLTCDSITRQAAEQFGKGGKDGLTFERFQQLYQSDPFYS